MRMVWYAMGLAIALLSVELRCMGFVLGGRKCSVPSGCTGWRHSPTQRNLFGGGKKGDKKPGMGNMLDSLKKANEIGQKTQQLQKELQDVRITGVSASGKVKITMTGSQVPVSCEISEDAMPESTESLSASVTEAMGAAHKESLEKMTKKMTELYSDMGLPGIGQG